MKNLLIVCPRFPPVNAADCHRVRLSLPYYAAEGWDATVLAVVDDTGAPDDEMLLESLPRESRVVRVPAWPERICRKLGFGQLDYRAFVPLLLGGRRLLREKRFDVVLFSSTVFLSFVLGPIWKRIFGCKIVYDYQDPWYYGDQQPYTPETVPGTWWKFRLGQAIARVLEPVTLRAADHVISVSQGYVDTLCRRYAFLSKDRFTVLPFPASQRDFDFVDDQRITQSVISTDGKIHWVYAGRGGHDMHRALDALFGQLANLVERRPELRPNLKLHFVGTSYAPPERGVKTIAPLSEKFGIADMVIEQPERIPYFETLSLYRQSDLILMIGSEHSDYTASKLLNCILAKKKVLAVFHQDSLVTAIAGQFPCVSLASFGSQAATEAFEGEVMRGLIWALTAGNYQPCGDEILSPWLAEASTRVQCGIFDRISRDLM